MFFDVISISYGITALKHQYAKIDFLAKSENSLSKKSKNRKIALKTYFKVKFDFVVRGVLEQAQSNEARISSLANFFHTGDGIFFWKLSFLLKIQFFEKWKMPLFWLEIPGLKFPQLGPIVNYVFVIVCKIVFYVEWRKVFENRKFPHTKFFMKKKSQNLKISIFQFL